MIAPVFEEAHFSCSISDVVESARETLKETYKIPGGNEGVIEYGPLKGKASWRMIGDLITHGYFGKQYTSLKQFLTTHNIVPAARKNFRHVRRHVANPPETVHVGAYRASDILESAQLHQQAEGLLPTQFSGPVKYGPLAGKTSWDKLEDMLRAGKISSNRSMTRANSLNSLFKRFGLKDTYTIDQVVATLTETYEQTGQWLTGLDNSLIMHGPLKGRISAWDLRDAILNGTHGLHDTGFRNFPEVVGAAKTRYAERLTADIA